MTDSIGRVTVAQLDGIYKKSIQSLREAMLAFARTGATPGHDAVTERRFCYP